MFSRLAQLRPHSDRLAWRPHALPLAALILPLLIFHWKIVGMQGVITGGDFINQFYPWRLFALTELGQGRFPFWNPSVFCGTPLAANIQTSLFYPFNVLHAVLPAERLFSWSLVFHQGLAGLCMYWFALRATGHPAGALAAALVYQWSGFLVTHGHDGHLIHMRAYALIPLALGLQTPLLWGWRVRPLIGLGACLALMFYGGHIQIPFYVFYLLMGRAAWHGALAAWQEKRLARALGPPLITLGALGLSLLFAMTVLLPLAQLAQYTAGRTGGASYAFATSDSMPPAFLATFIAPFFYGDPTHAVREQQFWLTGTGYHELCGYIGVFTLVLAAMAFLREAGRTRFEAREAGFFALAAGFGLLFALGSYNPLYAVLYYGLPGWSYFRVPARLVLLFIIGASVLAGFGLRAWMRPSWPALKEAPVVKIAIVASLLVPLAGLIVWLSTPGLLGWLREWEIDRTIRQLQLWRVPREQISAQLPEALFEARLGWMIGSLGLASGLLALGWISLALTKAWKTSWSAWLPAGVVLVDLLIFSQPFMGALPLEEWRRTHFPDNALTRFLQAEAGPRVLELDDAIGNPGLAHHPELRPNRLMAYGVDSARGYDPLILAPYAQRVNQLYGREPEAPQGGLLFFTEAPPAQPFAEFATPYLITTQTLETPYELVYEEPGSAMKVYHFAGARPPFYWAEARSGEGIAVQAQTPTRVVLQVETDEEATLVWAQASYPGWRVAVHGEEKPLSAGHKPWMAVRLDAGAHKVVFSYEGWIFGYGLMTSVLAVLCAGWLWRRAGAADR